MGDAKIILEARPFRKPFIPPPFEISSDLAVFWINRIILSVRASRFIACLPQLQLYVLQPLPAGSLAVRDCLQGSVKAERCNRR
ncbi:hypothetical protein CP49_40030 [Bradyrhizobium valentinum]|uniref:Uncharacterized protein n=1 Tax=Bradyrhizobium valentinum TaxID=1518501 RepID=A0A0R3LIR6_9BRAD|nr:hypothetical protein CP49_40030 [Bradyrhizobium valentinum]